MFLFYELAVQLLHHQFKSISMTFSVYPQRPVAMQCVKQMQEPSFPCLRYVLSCDSHSQLFLSQLQGYSAVFWDGGKEDRLVSTL